MKINAVTACWSSLPYQQAVQKIAEGTIEPILGQLSYDHVQLCPQHPDYISFELLDILQEKKNTLMKEYSDSKTNMDDLFTIRKNFEQYMGKEMER